MTEPPQYLGVCPVHFQEFYVPLDDPTTSLACPEMICDRLLVVYRRMPSPQPPSARALEIARKRFGLEREDEANIVDSSEVP